MSRAAQPEAGIGAGRDWWELTKPRLNFLVLLTSLAGYALAPKGLPDRAPFWAFVAAIWLLQASAAILNMWLERDSDALMDRTKERPLAAKRMDPRPAFWVGLALTVMALGALALSVNAVTAALGLLTWASYLLIYTPLKRVSPLSVLVGAVPGALPPVMGWTAAGGALDVRALGLFCLLFVWQIPHFLSIATLYGEQYRAAGIKVLGLEHGYAVVGRQIVIYTSALLPLTLYLPRLGLGGQRYRLAALALGLAFLAAAFRASKRPDRARARALLLTSVFYLPLLFAAMIADNQVR